MTKGRVWEEPKGRSLSRFVYLRSEVLTLFRALHRTQTPIRGVFVEVSPKDER